jgi:hypothetical protein
VSEEERKSGFSFLQHIRYRLADVVCQIYFIVKYLSCDIISLLSLNGGTINSLASYLFFENCLDFSEPIV